MRRVRLVLLLVTATLPAIIFLWQDGYFASSDGMIHLYRLFELDRALHEGVLFPRWFPLSGFGYGLPVLNYYPPLTYYFAEAFHLAGVGYIAAIKLTIAASFVIAAFSMFLFAREWLNEGAAFVAAIAYTYSPYLLSDAYVRGNFPEMLAISVLPFALWVFARALVDHASSFVLLCSISFAAIILTHHLTAMQFAALLLAYLAFLFFCEHGSHSAVGGSVASQENGNATPHLRWSAVVRWFFAILAGLLLSAFYWVPALAELNLVYVDSASVARFLVSRLIDPADFFAPALVYTYLPQSDALKHAFGFPQTMLALLAGVVALFHATRATHPSTPPRSAQGVSRITPHVVFFSLLVAFSIFMTLTLSTPLWYAIPTLRFLQFPWRFQILAAIGIAFLLGVWAKWIGDALAVSHRPWRAAPGLRTIASAAFAIALIALGVANLPVRAFPLNDADVDLTRSNDSAYVVAQMGWGWTREFVPATVQEFENIYTPIAKPDVLPPDSTRIPPTAQIQSDGSYSRAFRVATAQPFELSLKIFFFPGWQAYIDGAPARTYARGPLGIATVAVPPGEHSILFRFEDTPLRVVVNVVSLATLVGVMGALFIARRRAFVVVCVVIMFLAALFVWRTRDARAPSPSAVAANLDQRVELVGYATERADESLTVTLYWLALNEMDRVYNGYVHLIDAAENIVAQHDGPTDQGLTPTTRWLSGEIVTDRHTFALRGVTPGEYRLAAGMYAPLENGFQNLGDRVDLGRVQVK